MTAITVRIGGPPRHTGAHLHFGCMLVFASGLILRLDGPAGILGIAGLCCGLLWMGVALWLAHRRPAGCVQLGPRAVVLSCRSQDWDDLEIPVAELTRIAFLPSLRRLSLTAGASCYDIEINQDDLDTVVGWLVQDTIHSKVSAPRLAPGSHGSDA